MQDELPGQNTSASMGAPPPAGSTMEIVEDSVERLALFIPAARKRGWELGCFGLIWLTIVSIITVGMATGLGKPGGPGPGSLFFLAPFWLVGLTILYFSLRLRHTRTLVLVEPTRAVLQQTFFGRTTTREIALAAGEPATLVESYRQNDVPVNAVCLKGESRNLKFGTALDHPEKVWIVDRINGFLGVTPAADLDDPLSGPMPTWILPETCSSCGGSLPAGGGHPQEATCPFCGSVNKAEMRLVQTGPSHTLAATGDFPTERVTVLEQTPDRLEFEMRVFENAAMRRGAAIAFGLFALIWNGAILTFLSATILGARFNAGALIMLVFLLPFFAVGVAIAGAAIFIAAGRLRVRLDRDELRAAWGVGPFRYTKRFATDEITHVTVENSPMAVKNQRRRSSADPETRMAIVWATSRWIPVTMLQKVNDCRHVAELVRGQLATMGFEVDDRRSPEFVSGPRDDDDEASEIGFDEEESVDNQGIG